MLKTKLKRTTSENFLTISGYFKRNTLVLDWPKKKGEKKMSNSNFQLFVTYQFLHIAMTTAAL